VFKLESYLARVGGAQVDPWCDEDVNEWHGRLCGVVRAWQEWLLMEAATGVIGVCEATARGMSRGHSHEVFSDEGVRVCVVFV
jgi:hypothetical protein